MVAPVKTETFTCDRCKHAQARDRKFGDADRWMKTIDVVMRDGYTTSGAIRSADHGTTFVKTVIWCDQCCAEMGIGDLHSLSPRVPDAPPQPTIEDMLREIMREEIGSAGQ